MGSFGFLLNFFDNNGFEGFFFTFDINLGYSYLYQKWCDAQLRFCVLILVDFLF